MFSNIIHYIIILVVQFTDSHVGWISVVSGRINRIHDFVAVRGGHGRVAITVSGAEHDPTVILNYYNFIWGPQKSRLLDRGDNPSCPRSTATA